MKNKMLLISLGLLLAVSALASGCTTNSSGSGLRQLTSGGPNSSFYPAWSPDGKRIVYEVEPRDRDKGGENSVWAIDSNGSNARRLVINERWGWVGAPVYSPDGKTIAYYHNLTPSIWLIDAEGSNNRPLSLDSDGYLDFPAWSPDGSHIASTKYQDQADKSKSALWIMNADGSGGRVLVDGLSGRLTKSWSPDGKRLVFSSGGDLWTVNGDGTGLMRLANWPEAQYEFPDWSPDASRIVFQSMRKGESGSNETAIEVVDSDGSQRQVLVDSHSRPDWSGKILEAPRWSPDGHKIAFDVWDNENGGSDIWVLDVNVRLQRTLASAATVP